MAIIQKIAFGFIFIIFSACVTTTPQYDINKLLQPDPHLPKLEEVEIMGTLAIQRVIALTPENTELLQTMDSITATSAFVTILFKLPTEQLASDPERFEIALYSLAHQWGRTQIVLDYVNRYDKLLTYRYEELTKKRKSLALSNFFYALSSTSYGMSNAYSTSTEKLSNQLSINQNQQSIQINNQLSALYHEKEQDIEDVRLQISQLKQQLISYSNLLETYVSWLLEESTKHNKELPANAVKILEVKTTL